ncbi:TetR/AcrR family transcriptional regulator [Brachybacterium saurashtrense]|uniref:TetR/AcrR family transcriptional regulator n=1 Tax=Brachybacterium saurashtrense TaxID=556288 RepID=A0A345YSN5_9MICO|nr:TetR/AcrR family transcriptional regulator [Brachybacterium saurashtrense]AXK46937.1 TetR/AcrR family transcriptional regulator [Brachybacterium saurashtrense]RRR22652.1 TetR/AcrR family transcriptional regulator [Brachybacterium saurashtrense]
MSTSSDRAPDPRPARTKAAIFAAARDLTIADGEVTVNALAKRAGVSRAAFYSHFSGLDALMAAMLEEMFEAAWARGRVNSEAGYTITQHVQHGYSMMVAYVERHHTFLRGALDWKFSHRTYMILADTLTALHVQALERMPDALPARPDVESLARVLTGAELAQAEHWLVETEQDARAGAALDATGLLETILAAAPSWYTGLGAEEPIDAAGLLESARTYEGPSDAAG